MCNPFNLSLLIHIQEQGSIKSFVLNNTSSPKTTYRSLAHTLSQVTQILIKESSFHQVSVHDKGLPKLRFVHHEPRCFSILWHSKIWKTRSIPENETIMNHDRLWELVNSDLDAPYSCWTFSISRVTLMTRFQGQTNHKQTTRPDWEKCRGRPSCLQKGCSRNMSTHWSCHPANSRPALFSPSYFLDCLF